MTNIIITLLIFILSVAALMYFRHEENVGHLIMIDDPSDPDGPYIFLELKTKDAVDKIKKMKRVSMDVEIRSAK